MSAASTPTRSSAASAARLPSNSPCQASPYQLTPRSKIKAMLAAVDDSDTDQDPIPAKVQARTTQEVTDAAALSSLYTLKNSALENESSLDELTVPYGKLAARLQRNNRSIGTAHGSLSASDMEEVDDGNAYERVKRNLVSKADNKKQNRENPSSGQESADDENDGPLLPRRRRMAASTSPDTPRSAISAQNRSPRSSPGLFLSSRAGSPNISHPKSNVDGDSDFDLPTNPKVNERTLALIARKRAERQAKEAAEADKRAATERQERNSMSRQSSTPLGDSEDDSDTVGAKKLTQQARPTRKASKKALEEMNRETQRMNRNMQLAHQARTKKKVTKESLFARFNFRTPNAPEIDFQKPLSSSTAVSSKEVSEAEGAQQQDTPPTSPAQTEGLNPKAASQSTVEEGVQVARNHVLLEDEELPTINDIMRQPKPDMGKGKGIAVEPSTRASRCSTTPEFRSKRQVKVHFPKPSLRSGQMDCSDSDLEILPARRSTVAKLDAFNPQGKVGEARSLQTLRALAHLHSPEKDSRASKASMTSSEMHMSLQQRARQQAAAERAEKIQDLKNRGIIVQTAEERQKAQVEVEDLVEKARQEAVDIKKKEKDAARKEAKKNGEDFNDSSEDDEDYQANEADESDIDLSGSEEEAIAEGSEDELGAEEEVDDEGEDDSHNAERNNGLVEDQAMEDADDDGDSEAGETEDITSDQEDEAPPQPRRSRISRILDEEEEDGVSLVSKVIEEPPTYLETPQKPTLPAIAFGTSPGLMGMTQAFAATMADSQTQAERIDGQDIEDSIEFCETVPEPNIPVFDSHDTESMIPDSQAEAGPETNVSDINLDHAQSQIDTEPLTDTQDRHMATQDYDLPEPTQDMGFHLSSPAGNRFVSATPSTVDTVLLPEQSPSRKKKGRLQRGRKDSVDSLDADSAPRSPTQSADVGISANAFDIMKRKRGEVVAAFDKKKSNAKEMVEEQAQESEDEYAGLGGASDDESGGDEDEETKRMIDEGEVEVDERRLAAFYADKERASDEQAISKLYKDINNGGLRRKRGGADFDLSDSDDDAEARQRAKRREFAKMRKALLTDEKLGKIAEDPKKMAFLRAVEDRENEEELGLGWDILDTGEEGNGKDEENTQEVADSQAQAADAQTAGVKRKRPLQESLPDATNRPPPAARRTKGKKPATLAEIRESVSFLIEAPESRSFQSHADSSDVEDENDVHDQATDVDNQVMDDLEREKMPPPPLPQHQNPRRTSAPIIDRLSLKRAASAESQAASSTRLAFMAPSATTSGTFHVPSLLRRASTSNLVNLDNNHGITTLAVTEQAAGDGDAKSTYVKKGGKKGSILGQAREMERRAVLDAVEKRRQEERERIARRRRSGFLAAGGSWG